MSMNNYGASGYVMPLEDLLKAVTNKDEVRDILAMEEEEEVTTVIFTLLPNAVPQPEVFKLKEEDNAEDLEVGVWYACWQDEDIWVRKHSAGQKALEKLCGAPVFQRWAVWG